MIEIRKASVKDAPLIVATRQKAWDTTYRGIYPDKVIDEFDWKWHLSAEQRRLSNPDFHCYIVLDGENCVGYVSYGRVKVGTWKDFLFRLHSLYLLPLYQGRGVGKQLFNIAKNACKEAGFTKMFLDCHPKNHNALGFYQHLGGMIASVNTGNANPQEDTCTIEYIFLE